MTDGNDFGRALRLALAGALLAGSACATTKLTSAWMDSGYEGGALRHVMVIGVSENPGGRRAFEDAFARRLGEVGVKAVSSASVLPEQGTLERETVEAWVREREIDGVLVTHLIGVEKQTQYVPPSYHHDVYGYYRRAWVVESTPGYLVEDTIVNLETNLYAAASGKLVWSAVSESFNPVSRDEVIHDVVGVLVDDLVARGLVPGP